MDCRFTEARNGASLKVHQKHKHFHLLKNSFKIIEHKERQKYIYICSCLSPVRNMRKRRKKMNVLLHRCGRVMRLCAPTNMQLYMYLLSLKLQNFSLATHILVM